MNIFVLCTGRCGSTTFYKACGHISNFTVSHEGNAHLFGKLRFNYPDNHIEIDNRLSWFLGRLDQQYKNQAFYVHLTRNNLDTAKSFLRRWDKGIISAYKRYIIMGGSNHYSEADALEVCLDYCETVNTNIELFLKDKLLKIDIRLENIEEDFQQFWNTINAEGSLGLALEEFTCHYNASS